MRRCHLLFRFREFAVLSLGLVAVAALCGEAIAATSYTNGVGAPTLNFPKVIGDFDDDTTQGWTAVRVPGLSAVGGVLTNANSDGLGSDGNADAYVWLNKVNSSESVFKMGELPGQYDIIQFDFRVDTPPPVDPANPASGQIDPRLRGRTFLQGSSPPNASSFTYGSNYQNNSSFPVDNNWRTYTLVYDFNDTPWEQEVDRLRLDLFDGLSNTGTGSTGIANYLSVLGAKFSIDNVILARTTDTAPFPAIEPALTNLVRNGAFSDVSNATYTSPDNSTVFNINGSNGNWGFMRGNTGDVDHWAPFNNNPNMIVEAVADGGALDLVRSTDGALGSFYLDSHWSSTAEEVRLNSAAGYLNGLIQTDILAGVTIDTSATYEFAIDVNHTNRLSDPNSTFTAALTIGANETDVNSFGAVTLLSNTLSNLPSGERQFISVSGATLKAAQDSGDPVNLILQSINTTSINNFPGGTPVPDDHADAQVTSQTILDNVSLIKTFVPTTGDVNKDGVVSFADLLLAQDYLAGNGGETAETRQNDLLNAPSAPFAADVLASLNLTDFDLNGDEFFDQDDVDALALLVPAGSPGDFNDDGVVDAADYTVWRDNEGLSESLLPVGSGDGSGTIDAGDYTLWTSNYGSTPGLSNSQAEGFQTPEPAAAGLALLMWGIAAVRRRPMAKV